MRTVLTVIFLAGFTLSAAQTTPTKTPSKATTTGQAAPRKPATSRATPKPAPAADPVAIFDTTVGRLTCTLFPKQAPKTVENFIGLATGAKQWTNPRTGEKVKGRPLYSGVVFHRVIPNFMVQTGDPLGVGTGGPGYTLPEEIRLQFDQPGRMGMAKSSLGVSGSQFFITEVPTPWLDADFTVFGQCDDASVGVVKQIARVPRDPRNNRPDQDIKINSITIVGGPKPAASRAKRSTPQKTAPPSVTPKKT